MSKAIRIRGNEYGTLHKLEKQGNGLNAAPYWLGVIELRGDLYYVVRFAGVGQCAALRTGDLTGAAGPAVNGFAFCDGLDDEIAKVDPGFLTEGIY